MKDPWKNYLKNGLGLFGHLPQQLYLLKSNLAFFFFFCTLSPNKHVPLEITVCTQYKDRKGKTDGCDGRRSRTVGSLGEKEEERDIAFLRVLGSSYVWCYVPRLQINILNSATWPVQTGSDSSSCSPVDLMVPRPHFLHKLLYYMSRLLSVHHRYIYRSFCLACIQCKMYRT